MLGPRERELTNPPAAAMDGKSFPPGPLSERPAHVSTLPSVSEVTSRRGAERLSERLSASNLPAAFRQTVRAVTPDLTEAAHGGLDETGSSASQAARDFVSPQSSPRSIASASATAGLPARRQGVVFNDGFPKAFDNASTSPPLRATSFRPRTHTMDGAFRQQLAPTVEVRNRMGSFSSGASYPASDDLRLPSLHSFEPYKQTDPPPAASTAPPQKDKKSSGSRSRLTKRPSSRPSSPLSSLPPSVDSLPLPVPTTDANKVLLLMNNLCGRMRGEVEYRRDPSDPWLGGMCYIEEEKGSLLFDPGDSGPFHTVLIPDLRGCRVAPWDSLGKDAPCLEITSPQLGMALFLRPLVAEEFDLWLAALLCWQQLRPPGAKPQPVRPSNVPGSAPTRVEMKRRVSSPGLRSAAIIKVGKIMLWDKGAASSPRAIVRRPSTRDLRSSQTCWRRVSCILHDNGELKIMTENDVTVLSVIELSQLARSAIQQLDKSVLDEDYCLAIFPSYATTSTQLSIFRPVYISLESRVLFEVWFVLLRAFTIPDVYSLDPANGGRVFEVTDLQREPPGETFRLEKTISVRITEAKLRGRTWVGEAAYGERHKKDPDPDPVTGNYLAEVVLDGEVRARTTTKTDTKNPFWREDCEFTDLPSSQPYLSILLKRVDGNTESFAHHIQSTLGLAKAGSATEVVCGSVDIPLHQMEGGKDHEQWLQICDDRQQSIGSMLVRVHQEEFVVLLQRHYQPLSELLHRFSSGLTAQIAEALPGNMRRLAALFVNIFQVSGNAGEWFMSMVEEEIDGIGSQTPLRKPRFSSRLKSGDSIESALDREQVVRDMGRSLQGEANLLFRGNSLLTQALEFHMRRLGREYLRETLAGKVAEINESDVSCEVDPSKVQHGENVEEHWNRLIQLTTEIWDCIVASATRLPPELRLILKYIRAVAEDRYGDFLRTVSYTSVSGFLFLRFLCPAILNPKLFGLLRDHPRPHAQRTLTLIAKSLQALANLSNIGKKETWMEPMNRFLTAQRQAFKDFLDAVCAIPADRTKPLLPASYSTPVTILGRLSPLAREGFPSLPYLVDQGRNFAALVKLWADAHPASTSESQVYGGDLLKFHTLCIDLHRRATDCHARIEAIRSAETASQLADDNNLGLSDVMDRISLGDMRSMSTIHGGGTAVWTEGEGGPPGSPGSEMDSSMSSPPFGTISISRDTRHGSFGREFSSSSLRQLARNAEASISQGGGATVRSLRHGIHPRKLLSGFIRKSRAVSPDAALALGSTMAPFSGVVSQGERERERDAEQQIPRDHNRPWERIRDRERDRGSGVPESRQPETIARSLDQTAGKKEYLV